MHEEPLMGDFTPYFVIAVLSAVLATVVIVAATGVNQTNEEETNFF